MLFVVEFCCWFKLLHGVVPTLGNAKNVVGEGVDGHGRRRGCQSGGFGVAAAVVVPSGSGGGGVVGRHHRVDSLLVGRRERIGRRTGHGRTRRRRRRLVHSAVRIVVAGRRLRRQSVRARVVASGAVQASVAAHLVHGRAHGHRRIAVRVGVGRRVGARRRRVGRRLGAAHRIGTVREAAASGASTASAGATAALTRSGAPARVVGLHFGEGGQVTAEHLRHVGEEGRHRLHHGRFARCSLLLQLQVLLFYLQHRLINPTTTTSTSTTFSLPMAASAWMMDGYLHE